MEVGPRSEGWQLGKLELWDYFLGLGPGTDSHPRGGIQGEVLASPSGAVPKQGAQQKVGQMPGLFLQTAKQLLALWCHRLRYGGHFSLNQSQHLWGRREMGGTA